MQKVIVIVGGGFAGAYCAKYLERWLPKDWELILDTQQTLFPHIVWRTVHHFDIKRASLQ